MGLSDKIKAVSRMQYYIIAHLDESITLDDIAKVAGYSKYHAARIFKELTGRTLFETIRALRLTKAAQTLQSFNEKVVDVAISSGFNSHDGFTRAFFQQFGLTPQKYHMETPPIKWFVHYPIEAYYILDRVEQWGFHRPLIKPYMRFSRIRLSDILLPSAFNRKYLPVLPVKSIP